MNIQTNGLDSQGLNGILGLCADPASTAVTDPVDSILKFLYDQGAIESKVISFALRGKSGTSYADVGFYDEAVMTDPSALVWIPVVEDKTYKQFWWQNYL